MRLRGQRQMKTHTMITIGLMALWTGLGIWSFWWHSLLGFRLNYLVAVALIVYNIWSSHQAYESTKHILRSWRKSLDFTRELIDYGTAHDLKYHKRKPKKKK